MHTCTVPIGIDYNGLIKYFYARYKSKIKYFARLANLDYYRWPKLLFSAITTIYDNMEVAGFCQRHSCQLPSKSCILSNARFSNPTWLKSFYLINSQQCNIDWDNVTYVINPLRVIMFILNARINQKTQYLLDNLDFYGATVSPKFKARSNTLPLDGRVRLCNYGILVFLAYVNYVNNDC